MTGGRVPVRGGMAWGRLSWDIGIRSLEQYRSDKAANLNFHDARQAHKQIRDAVNLYRLAHGTPNARGGPKISGPQTRTQIIEAVKKVKVNAAGVVRSGCEEKWLNRLYDALSVKVNLLFDLHYAVIQQGVDIWRLKSRINPRGLSSQDLAAVKVLAEIEVDKIVPPRGHPDPPLERLVHELTPLWSSVTGTSAYQKNDNEGGKVCPFAEWLSKQIKDAGLPAPPENTIPLIIYHQKSKNRVPQ